MHRAARRDQPVEALAQRAGWPIGPAPAPPAQTAAIAVERACATALEVDAAGRARAGGPRRARSAPRGSRARVRRDDHADVDELAALDARHDADDRVVIRAGRRARRASSTNARGASQAAARSSRRRRARCAAVLGEARVVAEPVVGDQRDDRARCARASGAPPAPRRPRRARSAQRQQHVVLDRGNGLVARAAVVGPVVVEVERRAVVDQPELAVPDQQVGVARRAVDVGDEGVEPDDARGELGVGLRGERVEGDRARQVVEARG